MAGGPADIREERLQSIVFENVERNPRRGKSED
jgi:hypothetical protein